MSEEFIIDCPCCKGKLWIDKNTGKVIKSENIKTQQSKKSLDELLKDEENRKNELNNQFENLFDQEKNITKLAEQQFNKIKQDLFNNE